MTIKWSDAAVRARIKRGAFAGVVIAAEAVREAAVGLVLNPPKTGRVYRRRGVEHQASAPGEAPASDTGRLARSITVRPDEARTAATVNASTEYAAPLEFGTQRVEPRPYMRPALASVDVADIVIKEVRRALATGG